MQFAADAELPPAAGQAISFGEAVVDLACGGAGDLDPIIQPRWHQMSVMTLVPPHMNDKGKRLRALNTVSCGHVPFCTSLRPSLVALGIEGHEGVCVAACCQLPEDAVLYPPMTFHQKVDEVMGQMVVVPGGRLHHHIVGVLTTHFHGVLPLACSTEDDLHSCIR